MSHLTLALIMIIATVGPCVVIATIGNASIQALGRNPSAAPQIQSSMILAFIFSEAVAIMSLLVIFHLFVK